MLNLRLGPALLVFVTACSNSGARYATGPSCEERQAQLVDVLQSLPDQTLNSPLTIPLPTATLAGAFGKGPVLEVHDARLWFEGKEIAGGTLEDRARTLAGLVASSAGATAKSTLYVAASANVDMRTLQAYLAVVPDAYELRLSFARPASAAEPAAASAEADEETDEDSVYAEELLTERDPRRRREIAAAGYQEYSDCEAITSATSGQAQAPDATRWPALKRAMIEAVPRCECSDINPDGLRNLLVAEQRAGNVALGSMPAMFLKDTRCKASMPLRTVQQVLGDVEKFDAEFSGSWDETGVKFEEVVTNERLLNYLCSAMPGELFESVSAEFATVYVKTSKAPQCRGYRLEPVARGAVFGTFRGQTPGPNEASFHYRLGGNDLRVFGPLPTAESRATDEGPWACNKDMKLAESDAVSIAAEGGGRFYFTAAACERGGADGVFPSCVFDPTLTPLTAPPPEPPSPDTSAPQAQ